MDEPNHLFLVGPPRSGKIAYARRVAAWCGEPRETAADRSYARRVAGLEPTPELDPPFRAPHHTVSMIGLTGTVRAGYRWQPGEFSLAHGGTLLLDELPEFRLDCLEALRDAMTNGELRLSGRLAGGALGCVAVPTAFRLIATALPCPCGWLPVPGLVSARTCRCKPEEIERYAQRVPMWLRDRVEVVYPSHYFDRRAS